MAMLDNSFVSGDDSSGFLKCPYCDCENPNSSLACSGCNSSVNEMNSFTTRQRNNANTQFYDISSGNISTPSATTPTIDASSQIGLTPTIDASSQIGLTPTIDASSQIGLTPTIDASSQTVADTGESGLRKDCPATPQQDRGAPTEDDRHGIREVRTSNRNKNAALSNPGSYSSMPYNGYNRSANLDCQEQPKSLQMEPQKRNDGTTNDSANPGATVGLQIGSRNSKWSAVDNDRAGRLFQLCDNCHLNRCKDAQSRMCPPCIQKCAKAKAHARNKFAAAASLKDTVRLPLTPTTDALKCKKCDKFVQAKMQYCADCCWPCTKPGCGNLNYPQYGWCRSCHMKKGARLVEGGMVDVKSGNGSIVKMWCCTYRECRTFVAGKMHCSKCNNKRCQPPGVKCPDCGWVTANLLSAPCEICGFERKKKSTM